MSLYSYAGKLLAKTTGLSTSQSCCCGCTSNANCTTQCQVCCNGICQTPTASFTISDTTLNENQTVTATISTTCIPVGTILTVYPNNWKSQITPESLQVTLSSFGMASASFTVINDTVEEINNQYFNICFAYNGCEYCSASITINPSDLQIRRVCCINGVCFAGYTQAECAAAGGTWLPSATTCYETTCYGACCSPNGSCARVASAAFCDGSFKGAGVSCFSANCPQPGCNPPCGSCQVCSNQVCVYTCNGCQTCVNNQCVNACSLCQTCVNNTCVAKTCPSGQVCDPNTGNCVPQTTCSGYCIYRATTDSSGLPSWLQPENYCSSGCRCQLPSGPPNTSRDVLTIGCVPLVAFTALPDTIVAAQTAPDPPAPPPEEGPGTELKALLAKVGITSTPTCSCNARAMEMNRQGVQWCKDNEELILGWLKEEAEKRNLPFVKFGARMLLRRAIRNAEKKASQPPKDE